MRILLFALYGNATFSLMTGLTLIGFSEHVAIWLGGVPQPLLIAIGIALLPFAGHLVLAARRKPVRPAEILYLTTLDFLWVLGSGIVLILGSFSMQGKVIIGTVALLVAIWGTLQAIGRSQYVGSLNIDTAGNF